ncbi:complement factor H isoform X2 [Eucyclogobius newberryi]|uniref:complement factor H isoform X2 n=1 Tax=Eucyclogobius newberryi TaxID=166745 RepID=UPI003B5C6BA2
MDLSPSAPAKLRIKYLCLLYLFVARTHGDCPRPQSKDRIVLTDESLLTNEYPDNIEITLTCANGYFQASGSGTMKCTDGKWGAPDLTCKKKDCGAPPPQPFMTYDLSQGTLFGAVAVVSCARGYMLNGLRHKTCYNAGWTGRTTKCEIVTCAMPEAISNGRNSWNSSDNDPKYGESILYKCDEGYTMTGKDMIQCTEEGEYDPAPPQCLGLTKADVFTPPTSTTTSPAQETSSTGTTSSGPRDNTHTSSATSTVSLFARGEDILRGADNTTTTIISTNYSQGDQNNDIIDTKKDVGYEPVIISVVCVTLVACIAVFFLHKYLNKRKGSPNGTAPIC